MTGQHFIGYERSAAGAQIFQGINPATGEKLPLIFHEATLDEVARAVEKAAVASESYRRKSGVEKADFLEKIAVEILSLGDELIQTAAAETALPEARLQGERGRTVGQLRLFAELLREGSWLDARIDTAQPARLPAAKPDLRQMQRPLGPVGVFGASNFPLAFSVAGGDTVSALAAGCPVIFKAHPAHPATCELVAGAISRAAENCGLPDGVFSLVQGAGTEVGMTLVQHPLLKAVGFTGSFRGGKALYDAAVRRPEPIPVYAEMGSTNPVFILPGALRERGESLASALAGSITLGVGQFCTNPGVFVVPDLPETAPFVRSVAEKLSATAPGFMLTGGIRQAYERGIGQLQRVSGTERLTASTPAVESGAVTAQLLRTTAKTAMANPELTDEVFGPASLTIVADDKMQTLAFARSLHGHLTATVHGTPDDLNEYADLIEILETKVGRVVINGFPTGVEVAHAMVHGGPYPATTDSRSTSVGTSAIRRFTRPVCYQDFPENLLPDELKNNNPLDIWRLLDGTWTKGYS
ncbi:MAG: aldehyde dehydrogenase (NADP(+)) [Cytophagaceae bacterium]|nr:aldehyde dehydrogenase (NADP(+)) [Cytophagaceae bacterium]